MSQAFSLMDKRYSIKVWATKSFDATVFSMHKVLSSKELCYLSEIIIVEGEDLSKNQAKDQAIQWLKINRAYHSFYLQTKELAATDFIDWDKVTKI